MRWHSKPWPSPDEQRIRVRFFWWPTRIRNTWYWLEAVRVREVWMDGLGEVASCWEPVEELP